MVRNASDVVTTAAALAGFRRAARTVAILVVTQIAGKAATLVWTLAAARTLSADDFGAFFLALAVATLLASMIEWGFDAALTQRAGRDPHRAGALLCQALVCQGALGLPVFAVTGLVVGAHRPTTAAALALWLVLVATLLDAASDSCRAAAAALQDQAGVSAALVVQRGTTAVLGVIALVADTGLAGLSVAFLLGSLVGLIGHLRAVGRLGIRLDWSGSDRDALRGFIRGTGALGLTTVVTVALFRLDATLLGLLRDDAAVAAYAAAYRLFETVIFVAFALRLALFPLMNLAEEPDEVAVSLSAGASAAATVYLLFGVVALVDAPRVIHLLYGGSYGAVSAPALRWLAAAPLAYALAYLGGAALQARSQYRGMLIAAVIATVNNVLANLWLIPKFAGTAAAATTTASYALQATVVFVLLHRVGVRPAWVRPLAAPLAAALVAAVVMLALRLPVVAEVALGSAAYAAVWFVATRRLQPEALVLLRHGLGA